MTGGSFSVGRGGGGGGGGMWMPGMGGMGAGNAANSVYVTTSSNAPAQYTSASSIIAEANK